MHEIRYHSERIKCNAKKFILKNMFHEEGGRRKKVWIESEQSVDMWYSSESLLHLKLVKMKANFPFESNYCYYD